MTFRSLAVVSIALAVGAASPSAAETKVIAGALPAASLGATTLGNLPPPPDIDSPAPPPSAPDPAAPAAQAQDPPGEATSDPGISAAEVARLADPPQSAWRRALSAILRLAPAASR